MRICVFGAGAVGGHFATRLAAAGHDVCVVVRGDTLAAVRANGLTLRAGGDEIRARVRASDRAAELGPQDLVICTTKSMGLAGFAAQAADLLGPETPVVFAQNGIPWWYDIGLGAARPRPPDLSVLDPGGACRRAIAAERIVGGVIYSANEAIAPGVIANNSPQRNILRVGEADDRPSARVAGLRATLQAAGIASPDEPDIRVALWRKLIVNMTASILCLLTGHKATVVRDDPRIGPVFLRLAREALAIAAAHGIDLGDYDPAAHRQTVPDHVPSIRQDYNRGKPLELDALLMVPVAFGQAAGLDTPCLDMLAALAQRMRLDMAPA
ncbi:MAG: 2-dehydropantoate 2-reductase [Alphaproteobacteria bacterium]